MVAIKKITKGTPSLLPLDQHSVPVCNRGLSLFAAAFSNVIETKRTLREIKLLNEFHHENVSVESQMLVHAMLLVRGTCLRGVSLPVLRAALVTNLRCERYRSSKSWIS